MFLSLKLNTTLEWKHSILSILYLFLQRPNKGITCDSFGVYVSAFKCDCMLCPGIPVDNKHMYSRIPYGRERRRIQGFVPVQRVGVNYERDIEDKLRNRNRQMEGARNTKGLWAQTLYALNSAVMKERVIKNLGWLKNKYRGTFYWTLYDGRRWRGVIINAGWCANRGYAVKVKYADGYVEWVLLRRLGLLEVEERAGMARVAGKRCVEERVTRVRNGELEELKGRFVGQKINKWFKIRKASDKGL